MTVLTLKFLEDHNACAPQRRRFRRRFGKRVNITIKLCRSVAYGFLFDWASENLLTGRQKNIYDKQKPRLWVLTQDYAYAPEGSPQEKAARRALKQFEAECFARAWNTRS